MSAANGRVPECSGSNEATTLREVSGSRNGAPVVCCQIASKISAVTMTAETLPTAAANCERAIREISGTSSSSRPGPARSRIVPASAAAVIDGCLVASVAPTSCMTTKLAA